MLRLALGTGADPIQLLAETPRG